MGGNFAVRQVPPHQIIAHTTVYKKCHSLPTQLSRRKLTNRRGCQVINALAYVLIGSEFYAHHDLMAFEVNFLT